MYGTLSYVLTSSFAVEDISIMFNLDLNDSRDQKISITGNVPRKSSILRAFTSMMYLTEIAVRELCLDFGDGATSITCIVTPSENRIFGRTLE